VAFTEDMLVKSNFKFRFREEAESVSYLHQSVEQASTQ